MWDRFAFAIMMMAPGIKKGPVTGPWGFMGYGSSRRRLDVAEPTWRRNNGHNSSDDELQNDVYYNP